MPIRLDYGAAKNRFNEALKLAKSNKELPVEWLEGTRKIGESPSKTFIAMLGTAFLAKATDRRVDPFALKVRNFPNAYSARGLCKDVLVPACVEAGVSLGTTGREPLNNQPFFRYERIALDMAVKGNARPYLELLCTYLGRLEPLDSPSSLTALAAFLRIRLLSGIATPTLLSGHRVIGLSGLVEAIAGFVARDPEGGRRGQAFVAACLDLVFDDVRTSRVNDPSRHWPGDIVAFTSGLPSLSVEVKQRAATETEIVQFVENLGRAQIRRAIVAALDPRQPDLAAAGLQSLAWERHQVHLIVFLDPRELFRAAFTWSALALPEALARFPQLVTDRLVELEVSPTGMEEWRSIFEGE